MLLGRAKSPDTTRRSLASIVDETSRLQQLIDNVLHFSRAERRLTRVAVEPLSLDGLVGRVAADFAPLVADRGIRLAVTIPADIVVVADPNAVRQILLNLLDNAARYGPEGQQISIGARRRGPLADCWVEDEGPGISVPDALRVWQPFVRLERDRESVVAGTGLGLAVVRELVLAQGGNCRIERGTYRGARIVIQLPIAPRLG
jgi:two-component system cell cycle sensor histidine kinase PleC